MFIACVSPPSFSCPYFDGPRLLRRSFGRERALLSADIFVQRKNGVELPLRELLTDRCARRVRIAPPQSVIDTLMVRQEMTQAGAAAALKFDHHGQRCSYRRRK